MSVRFHFLNVGSGDCTVVHFPARTSGQREKTERIMMVDMNHHDDHEEYEHIADYYRTNFRDGNGNVKPIFRFVCNHPHHDHICGIKGIFESQHIKICNFWMSLIRLNRKVLTGILRTKRTGSIINFVAAAVHL